MTKSKADRALASASKFLSLLLRHAPETVGLTLDEHGWAAIDGVVRLTAKSDTPLTRELIERIVAENDKKRFAISPDGANIRASQGHSLEVDLQLEAREPPEVLFHGTSLDALASIREQGLLSQSRQHVHLSADADTARRVGSRHGKPAVLTVQAGRMHAAGIAFYRSENGVWLADHVAVEWIDFT